MECSFPLLLWRYFVLTPATGNLPALLAEIPDPRGRQGLRHPLAAMLAAIVSGLLTGALNGDVHSLLIRTRQIPPNNLLTHLIHQTQTRAKLRLILPRVV